jgi:MazG family protein
MSGYPAEFQRLIDILKRLRSPDGCAWDREQTPETLRANIVEEAYECVDAVNSGSEADIREELGDLFMLAALVSCIMEESGAFTVSDVLQTVNEKLVRRHPHVFGDSPASTVPEIVEQWAKIKRGEKKSGDGFASFERFKALPPLERSFGIQREVAKLGFDWSDARPVLEKLHEELAELAEARGKADAKAVEEEIGDLLFTVVNLSRVLGVDPGIALQRTNRKFEDRFRKVEDRLKKRNLTPLDAGLSVMDGIWNQVKSEESKSSK